MKLSKMYEAILWEAFHNMMHKHGYDNFQVFVEDENNKDVRGFLFSCDKFNAYRDTTSN